MSECRIQARFQLARNSGEGAFGLDVDLDLPGDGITAIFGHSGSGKTTLLRCIAGLQDVSGGQLTVNGVVWQNDQHRLPTHKRPLGYVFQESSLFSHLSAQGNLQYALKRSGRPKVLDLYERVVTLMSIDKVLNQYPHELSGGERQRVAIARALLIDPALLMLDEPLASLDAERKQEILPYLERLRAEFQLPMLYVSHSVDEVARLADYLVVLDQGQVVAQGPLTEVLSRVDLPVRLGEDVGVVLEGRVTERDHQWHLSRADFAGGHLWVRDGGDAMGEPLRLRVLARDVSLSLDNHDDTSILNRLPATVVEVADDHDDAKCLIRLAVGESILIARITRRSLAHLKLSEGSHVWAQIKSVAVVR